MQSFNSFSGLSVIKSKKKQVILEQIFIIKWMKIQENDKNSKKVGKKQFLTRKL